MWPVFAGGMLVIIMLGAHDATKTNQHLTQQNQQLHSKVKKLKKNQIKSRKKLNGIEIKNLKHNDDEG